METTSTHTKTIELKEAIEMEELKKYGIEISNQLEKAAIVFLKPQYMFLIITDDLKVITNEITVTFSSQKYNLSLWIKSEITHLVIF